MNNSSLERDMEQKMMNCVPWKEASVFFNSSEQHQELAGSMAGPERCGNKGNLSCVSTAGALMVFSVHHPGLYSSLRHVC
jgi:hypothetical protein